MSTKINHDKYRDIVVKKPWGFEYLAYQNENLGIWLLHINENMKTSMHCHPKKNTGLICLQGSVEVSFLKNKIALKGIDKIMIFRGRFHSTQALGKGGAFILEVECPQDKHDLVRLDDEYGRKDMPYEGNECEFKKTNDEIWFIDPINNESNTIDAFNCHMIIKNVANIHEFHDCAHEEVFVVLRGGLITPMGDVIVQPGDVIAGHALKFLSTKFLLADNTTILSLTKNHS